MRDALARYNEELTSGLPNLAFGVGIHTGDVVAGVMGSDRLMEFATVIGDPVNIASRRDALTRTTVSTSWSRATCRRRRRAVRRARCRRRPSRARWSPSTPTPSSRAWRSESGRRAARRNPGPRSRAKPKMMPSLASRRRIGASANASAAMNNDGKPIPATSTHRTAALVAPPGRGATPARTAAAVAPKIPSVFPTRPRAMPSVTVQNELHDASPRNTPPFTSANNGTTPNATQGWSACSKRSSGDWITRRIRWKGEPDADARSVA